MRFIISTLCRNVSAPPKTSSTGCRHGHRFDVWRIRQWLSLKLTLNERRKKPLIRMKSPPQMSARPRRPRWPFEAVSVTQTSPHFDFRRFVDDEAVCLLSGHERVAQRTLRQRLPSANITLQSCAGRIGGVSNDLQPSMHQATVKRFHMWHLNEIWNAERGKQEYPQFSLSCSAFSPSHRCEGGKHFFSDLLEPKVCFSSDLLQLGFNSEINWAADV